MVSSAKEHIYMNLQGQAKRRPAAGGEEGYAMAALLVTIAIMAVLMTMAMPTWRQQGRREKEAELIFRAGQYVHAIELYKRKTANTFPPNIDVLIKGRFLRKKFTDPMTKNGEFRLLTPQELNATPSRILNPGGGPLGAGQQTGGTTSGRAGATDNRLGSGTALTGQGLGSSGSTTPMTPGASPDSGGANSSGTTGFGGTSAFGGQNGNVQVGPIAAVASRSTDQSIRIFKGRDHYNEWIVTIEDVVPRQFLRPQQGTQPGQQPGVNQGRPGSMPTGSTPSSPIR
jgi:type II secretory pathway pseudopilin PulG